LPENTSTSVPRPRLAELSDLIFGLALSIGAISFLTTRPQNTTEILADVVGFGFSFLILIFVWLRYTSIMSVLPVETSTTIFLNVIMLFLVSVEPYLFNLVNLFGHVDGSEVIDFASVVFALDMAGLMAILAFFTHQLSIEEKKLLSPELLWKYKRFRDSLFISAGLFLLTVLPLFWSLRIQGTPLRFYFWFVPVVVSWVRRVSQKTPNNSNKEPEK